MFGEKVNLERNRLRFLWGKILILSRIEQEKNVYWILMAEIFSFVSSTL